MLASPALREKAEHEFDYMVRRVMGDEVKDYIKYLTRKMKRESMFGEYDDEFIIDRKSTRLNSSH